MQFLLPLQNTTTKYESTFRLSTNFLFRFDTCKTGFYKILLNCFARIGKQTLLSLAFVAFEILSEYRLGINLRKNYVFHHSVEIWEIFCHSDFYVKSIGSIPNVDHIDYGDQQFHWPINVGYFTNFKISNVDQAISELFS